MPEIGLTPQTLAKFENLGIPVACLHSKLTDLEKAEQWHDIANNDVKLILGTRSAIFTPIHNLGIIIIDEEHDASFKQQSQWRYHARDIAGFLAKSFDIPLVLGSATPSLETYHNTLINKFKPLFIKERHQNRPLPDIITVDCKKHPMNNGFSLQTLELMTCLKKNHQIMVYLNRRGYAPVSICHACGTPLQCQVCDKNLTFHKKSNTFQCHPCQIISHNPVCKKCQSNEWINVGQGTENIHEFLEQYFKSSVIRLDRDTTSNYDEFLELLNKAKNHEASIIVGTQMLSKGHNFPKLQLVVILNVDQYLLVKTSEPMKH